MYVNGSEAKVSKSDLESYAFAKHDVRILEQELQNGDFETADTVTGSAASFPYTERTYTVRGVDEKRVKLLRARLERKRALCKRVENFVDNIEDSEMHTLIKLHYLEGMNWPKVRRVLRMKYITADALRIKVERYLQKFL